jgi:hypothetical protein
MIVIRCLMETSIWWSPNMTKFSMWQTYFYKEKLAWGALKMTLGIRELKHVSNFHGIVVGEGGGEGLSTPR